MGAASRAHLSELCCKDERSRESPRVLTERPEGLYGMFSMSKRPLAPVHQRFKGVSNNFIRRARTKKRTPCLELGRLAKAAPGTPKSDTEASVRRRTAPGRGGKGTLRRAGAGSGGRAGSHVVEDATVRRRGRRLSGLDGLGGAASLAEEAADSPGRRQ